MATLGALATLVDGQILAGDPQTEISGAATLRWAGPGDITLADSTKYLKPLAASRAAAVVVGPKLDLPETLAIPRVRVADSATAFARIVQFFRPLPKSSFRGISPAATIHPTAMVAGDATIYPGAWIDEHVRIGSRTIIHSGCRIMAGTVIGDHCEIFPNVVVYEGTRIGNRVLIHANAVIGAYGFGYASQQGRHVLSAQAGYVEIHDDVEVGACTTIDRGTYDATVIGEGTKIDNQVMIAHNCHIGRHNLLCSQVGIAGSCTTGDYVVMAGQVGVRDHVEIGAGARIGAKAGVAGDIAAGQTALGAPARPEKEERLILASLGKIPGMRKQLKSLERLAARMAAVLGLRDDEFDNTDTRSDAA